MADPNLDILVAAATVLQPMLDELVFVGGCTTGLLITDPAMPSIRATVDVDAIVEITSYGAYSDFSRRLRALGLREDTDEGAPICRWRHGDLKIDVMPLEERILGFSNRWYQQALEAPHSVRLTPHLSIQVITAPFFVATKLEAFRERGGGGYLGSHDLEDIVAVVDGRDSIVDEIGESVVEVRNYIAEQFRSMVDLQAFTDALPGFLSSDNASQDRAALVLDRLKRIAQLNS